MVKMCESEIRDIISILVFLDFNSSWISAMANRTCISILVFLDFNKGIYRKCPIEERVISILVFLDFNKAFESAKRAEERLENFNPCFLGF